MGASLHDPTPGGVTDQMIQLSKKKQNIIMVVWIAYDGWVLFFNEILN